MRQARRVNATSVSGGPASLTDSGLAPLGPRPLSCDVPQPVSSRPLAVWRALIAGVTVTLVLVALSERLPAPVAATAPAEVFSAARARPALHHLASSIGVRVTGSPEAARAAAYVEDRLRAIPGLEVERQDAVGVRHGAQGVTAYRTINVLARLNGDSSGSVLLSTHYDSAIDGPGAADAAAPVAVAIETMRALAAGPAPHHSVVLNVNGAEERGLLGASGFLAHRWRRDVQAFVDLESAGNAGKAILFQSGPRHHWLARAYGASVPYPYGSVIGQDIYQSGAVPSTTDFDIYQRAGIPGLDLAFFRGGWAYHTSLDRSASVRDGSVQHMGANALALVRELARGPLPGSPRASGSVYYDLLGLTLVVYSQDTAIVLAIAAALAVMIAIPLATRAMGLRAGDILRGALVAFAALACGVLLALLGSAAPPYLLDRPHGWFARPVPAVVAFAALTLGGMLLVHRLTIGGRGERPHVGDARAVAAWAGGLVVMLVLHLALVAAGIGSAYPLLWWIVAGSIGLTIVGASGARRWGIASLIGFVPGAIVTAQFGVLVVALFVPIAGRMPLSVPFDPVIALLVALPVAVSATLPLALVRRAGGVGRASVRLIAIGFAALAVNASRSPFTPDRPQRLDVIHEVTDSAPRVVVSGSDWVGPARAMRRVPGVRALSSGALWVPARGEVPLATPAIEVRAPPDSAARVRTLLVHLPPDSTVERVLRVPAERLAGWSLLDGMPLPAPDVRVPRIRFISAPDTGWTVTLRIRGVDPVALELEETWRAMTPPMREVVRLLPGWTTVTATVVRRSIWRY